MMFLVSLKKSERKPGSQETKVKHGHIIMKLRSIDPDMFAVLFWGDGKSWILLVFWGFLAVFGQKTMVINKNMVTNNGY